VREEEEKKKGQHLAPGPYGREAQSNGPHDPSGRDAAHGEVLDAVSKWARPLLSGKSGVDPSAYQLLCHSNVHAFGRKRTLVMSMHGGIAMVEKRAMWRRLDVSFQIILMM
jgi:hypothetical protein